LIWIAIALFIQTCLLVFLISSLEKSRRRHADIFFRVICTKLGIPLQSVSDGTPSPPESSSSRSGGEPPSPQDLLDLLINPSEGEARQAYDELKQHPELGHIYRPWNDPDV
jgi:hypothetical protein